MNVRVIGSETPMGWNPAAAAAPTIPHHQQPAHPST
jgi:hypothetical protein